MPNAASKLKVMFGLGVWLIAAVGTATAEAATYTYEIFDVPGAGDTFANGINERGDVVGGYSTPSSTGLSGFSRINGQYTVASDFLPLDINTAGIQVGVNPQAGFAGEILNVDGSRTNAGPPGSIYWRPEGITDTGQITGYMHTATTTGLGFVWYGSSVFTLGFPLANSLEIRNRNAQGQLVGIYATGPTGAVTKHGFLWEGGVFTELIYPGSIETLVFGINDAGTTVGTASLSDGTTLGFVRDRLGHYDVIGLSAWAFVLAEDINNRGQVVGHFFDGTRSRGFLATPFEASTPVALPSTALLVAIGIAALHLLQANRPSRSPQHTIADMHLEPREVKS